MNRTIRLIATAALAFGAASASGETLIDNLAVYLPFNGDTANHSPWSGAVTAAPEPTASNAVVTPNGFAGDYLKITSGGYVKLPGTDTGSLSYGDNNKTFSAIIWVRLSTWQKTDPVILGNNNWSGNAKGFILASEHGNVSKVVNMHAGNGSTRFDVDYAWEDANQWTFYAVVCDKGSFSLYQGKGGTVNTLTKTAETLSNFGLDTGYPFYIGQAGTGKYGKLFIGDVDDFALWTRALSHEDIQRIYECGRTGMDLGNLLKIDANDAPEMSVASSTAESIELSFGGRRTKNLALCLAHGAADGESDKHSWDSFETLATIAPSDTSYTYSIPMSFREAESKLRFFLMQTSDLPYAKEVAYAHSDGTAWIDSGVAPKRFLVSEFDVRLTSDGTVTYQNFLGAFGTDGKKLSNYGLCRIVSSNADHPSSLDREYNNGTTYQFTASNTCVPDTDYHIAFSTTNLVVNGTAYGSGIAATGFLESGIGVNLFRCAKLFSGTAVPAQYDGNMIGYFKSFKLSTPERTARDFKPVETSEGTVGMFDAVTGEFYGSSGGALAAGADLDSTRYGWVRAETETFTGVPPNKVVTATYTGLGTDPLDFADGANWICCNINGTQLPSTAVPDADTAITVAGATPFAIPQGTSMPACASIKFDSAMPAAGASDWTGLDYTKVTSDSVIDLKGGMLSLPAPNGTAANAFTVTDTSVDVSSPGTLEFNVASGTFANSAIALSGNLKLVKTGAGTFQPAKASQTYTGGTEANAGTIRLSTTASGRFGTGAVTVNPNGVFDANGKDASSVTMVLAGGKLCSTATSKGTYPKKLALTEDSTLEQVVDSGTNDMDIPGGCDWNLGGKTLSVDMGGNDTDLNMIDAVNYISNGTFRVSVGSLGAAKGYFAIRRLDGRDGLKLDLGNSYVRLQSASAHSYVYDFMSSPPPDSTVYSYKQGGPVYRLGIFGRYTPPASSHTGFQATMMDGSTIDLTAVTGAWNCKFTNPGGYASGSANPCWLQIATSAQTIHVDLTGRNLKAIAAGTETDGPYVLKWHTGAVPGDGVTFVPDAAATARGYYFEKDATGLKLEARKGFTIRISGLDGAITLPAAWALEHLGVPADSLDSEAEAEAVRIGANGLPMWQSYCLGLNPGLAESVVLCELAEDGETDGGVAVKLRNVATPGSGLENIEVTAYLDCKTPSGGWNQVAQTAVGQTGAVLQYSPAAMPSPQIFRARVKIASADAP